MTETTPDRDYLAEMNQRITAATDGTDWVPAVVAEKLHQQLAETDPDLLDGWLHATAVQALTALIGGRERGIRAVARHRAGARAFDQAAGAGVMVAGSFAVTFMVDETNLRRRVADMTGADHRFVAAGYRETESTARMLAAFHEAIAGRVGDRRTAEAMGEAEYDRLYRSIAGPRSEVGAA